MKIFNIFPLFVTVSATIILTASQCFAGAWTLPLGTFYDRLALNYYSADQDFNNDGDKKDMPFNGDFSDKNVSNYMEYGLTDGLTLVNALYFKQIKREDDYRRVKTYGMGDIDLGVRAKLLDGHLGILSFQGIAKIPVAYDRHDELPLGNGQYDLEGRVLYGRSLWPYIPGYCNLELGYRVRFEDPSDEFRYLVEVGGDFTKQLYGRVKLDGLKSIDNGNHADTSGNPTSTNNFDLGKLDVALGYKMTKSLGVELGYNPAIYGKNTAAGSTYSLALTFQNN